MALLSCGPLRLALAVDFAQGVGKLTATDPNSEFPYSIFTCATFESVNRGKKMFD